MTNILMQSTKSFSAARCSGVTPSWKTQYSVLYVKTPRENSFYHRLLYINYPQITEPGRKG